VTGAGSGLGGSSSGSDDLSEVRERIMAWVVESVHRVLGTGDILGDSNKKVLQMGALLVRLWALLSAGGWLAAGLAGPRHATLRLAGRRGGRPDGWRSA
jgi:hypothetical protein